MFARKLSAKLLSAATFALALGAAAGASADNTAFLPVASIWQYTSVGVNAGNTYVYIKGATCTPSGSNTTYFIVRGDNTKQDQMMSLLLAAQLSGKSVGLTYDAGTCVINSVHIK